MNNPLWDRLVASRESAYECSQQFGDSESTREPIWCFRRFGQSITRLPDGRHVEIGGEHEDFYDPNFCIYNDLVVHTDGPFEIFGYPEELFPATDFHSATLIWPYIWVIGNLGYAPQRRPGETPVFRVDCRSWSIERIDCSGPAPGWIHAHLARADESGRITISGGKVIDEPCGDLRPNPSQFVLDTAERRWR